MQAENWSRNFCMPQTGTKQNWDWVHGKHRLNIPRKRDICSSAMVLCTCGEANSTSEHHPSPASCSSVMANPRATLSSDASHKPIAGPDINHIYICEYVYTHTPPSLPTSPRLLFTFIPTERWLAPGFNPPPAKPEAKEEHWSSFTQDGNILDKAGALPAQDRSVIFLLSRSFLLYYSWVYFTIDGPVMVSIKIS